MMDQEYLWWLKTLFWVVRASQPTKKSENKTPGVFFHAEFDFDAPGLQNTTQKSKNDEKLNFLRSIFQNR